MAQWHDVGGTGDIGDGEAIGVSAGGTPVALFKLDGEFFALHDRCSHGQAMLSEGYIEDGNVECPLHQGLVCIRTGEPVSPPITREVEKYPVRVVGDRVEVEV
jgi:nitrite reductase/ring-hydroxylating ferredoxin subunit